MTTKGTLKGERSPQKVTFMSLLHLPWWEGEFGGETLVYLNLRFPQQQSDETASSSCPGPLPKPPPVPQALQSSGPESPLLLPGSAVVREFLPDHQIPLKCFLSVWPGYQM